MERSALPRYDSWSVARFPSRGMLQEFLDQVRLWNKVEGLPQIDTEPLNDGVRVRIRSRDAGQKNLRRLVDAFGGSVTEA